MSIAGTVFLNAEVILTCRPSVAEGVAEAASILPKDIGLVRLDDPMDSLDMTKMMAKEFETEKQKFEEPSLSGNEVEEADTA